MTFEALETARVLLRAACGGPGARAVGRARGGAHRLERLRRGRPEGMLHRLAADQRRPPGATASRSRCSAATSGSSSPSAPARTSSNEVSFTGGYPFREGSTVTLDGRRRQLHPRPGPGRRRRMGLDRPRRRRARGGGDAPRRRPPSVTGTSARGTDDRGHLLAVGLHRRGRGRRGALPLRPPPRLALSARNRYVGRRAPRRAADPDDRL